jgi:hypothetical protein
MAEQTLGPPVAVALLSHGRLLRGRSALPILMTPVFTGTMAEQTLGSPVTMANFPSVAVAGWLAAQTNQLLRCGGEGWQSRCPYSFVDLRGNLSVFFEKMCFFVFFRAGKKKSIFFRDASRFRTTYNHEPRKTLKVSVLKCA